MVYRLRRRSRRFLLRVLPRFLSRPLSLLFGLASLVWTVQLLMRYWSSLVQFWEQVRSICS